MNHQITRVRHEIVRRHLTVRSVTDITPNMRRIELEGPELAGFTSLGADDHVKLMVPGADGEVERRDYTPRRYDAAANVLTLDFALHEAGPATAWALQAAPGASVQLGGPRGSMVIPWSFDWYLLVGDETALPAIGRRIEEAPAGKTIISLAAVTGPDEEQHFQTAAALSAHWVHRPAAQADDAAALLAALRKLELPAGDGFIWIAAEAKVARALRDHVRTERNHPPGWTKASGYWLKGEADSAAKLDD